MRLNRPWRIMPFRIWLAFALLAFLAACTSTGPQQVAGSTTSTHLLRAPAGEAFRVAPVDLRRVPARFHRQVVPDPTGEKPGTIVVDPGKKYLYLVMKNGEAMRYGIGVGREGFGWSGRATIQRKAAWPTWTPPAEMITRQPEVAKWASGMPGGPENPLGARAMYLYQGGRDTLYRIHGTSDPASIGRNISSGCIRLLNADVIDLYNRVPTGTKVVVLDNAGPFAVMRGWAPSRADMAAYMPSDIPGRATARRVISRFQED